jgi:hypothetical protein
MEDKEIIHLIKRAIELIKTRDNSEYVAVLTIDTFNQLLSYFEHDKTTDSYKLDGILVYRNSFIVTDNFIICTLEYYNKTYRDLQINLN